MTPSEDTTTDQAIENALLRKDVELLTSKVEKLSNDVEQLVAAWNTATYVVAFVKWLAGTAAAIGVLLAFVKGFGK